MAPSFDGRSNWALLVAGGLATHISSFSPFMRLNTKQIDSPFGRQNLIIQEIQVNVKRLGRQFWRCWHCLWGSSSRPRCFLGEPTPLLSPVRGSGGGAMRGKALGSSCHTRQELQEGRSTHWTQTRCRLWQDSGKQKRAAGPNKVLDGVIEPSDNLTEASNYWSRTRSEYEWE